MPTAHNSTVVRLPRSRHRQPCRPGTRSIAGAYDHAGEGYGAYADGNGDLSRGHARFAQADGIVWRSIRKAIDDLRETGISSLRVLDAGCGPGTWLKRVAGYCHSRGVELEAVGFDISKGQLAIARRRFAGRGNWKINFVEHDLANLLPWADGHFHIVLCNYVVLNHLSKITAPRAVEELCRVSSHRVVVTLRSLASPPTGCIIGTEQIREYHQDCERGELKVLLKDGTEHCLTFNLYSAEMLTSLFAPHARLVDMRAIDVFSSRFAVDPNWTANLVQGLAGRQQVVRKLMQLEERLCRLPGWIDHGTHILVIAEPSHASTHATRATLKQS